MNTYYLDPLRGFANEYAIHIATDAAHALSCANAGYQRIPRTEALSRITRYVSPYMRQVAQNLVRVRIDGRLVFATCAETAAALRAGDLSSLYTYTD